TLEDAHAQMRAAGLHVGLLGTGIPHFYRRLGWERAGRQRLFTIDRASAALLPDPAARSLDVTEHWRPHAAALAALHNAEPLGAQRTPEMFTLLAERRADRLWVATRDRRAVAYTAFRGGSIREYGGEPEDVAALLR